MPTTTVPHLNRRGDAREALEFYASVFGGHLTAITYGDFGAPQDSPDARLVVWGQVVADGFQLMAYDVPGSSGGGAASGTATTTTRQHGTTVTDAPFFLSVRGESVEEVTTRWAGLSEGATVLEPLAASPWAPAFGMLTDRFGTTWIVDVAAPSSH